MLSWLYCTNSITKKLFQYIFYTIKFGLAWDLINSIKNPFDSTDTRYKKILISIPILLIVIFLSWNILKLMKIPSIFLNNKKCGDYGFDYMLAPIELLLLVFYCIYTFWAICIAAKGLLRKGLNK